MIDNLKKTNQIENLFLFFIAIICLFSLYPFIFLACLNLPEASDDFFHAVFHTKNSYWEGIKEWYTGGYNGRYANAIFMLLPGRPFMNVGFSRTFPIVIIVFLYIGLLLLFDSLNRKKWKHNIIYSLIVITFFYTFIPDIKLFYWYSGATVYIFSLVMYIFLLDLFIRFFNKKQNIFYIISSVLLLFLIIGSHENWMIISFITIILFVIDNMLKKEKN